MTTTSTTSFAFKKATRHKAKLRLALCGPAGSGKSFTALRFAFAIAAKTGGSVAAIDTEAGSLSLYTNYEVDGQRWEFDVLELDRHSPSNYSQAIQAAAKAGYSVLVIDSLSHAWSGVEGALDQVDRQAAKSKSGNTFTAWKDVTPQHTAMVESILRCPMHVIATMRTKMEYVLEDNGKGGMRPVKKGMAPIQRAGMEYEFTCVADLDEHHIFTVSKTRCPAWDDMAPIVKPGPGIIDPLWDWLEQGTADQSFYEITKADEQMLATREKAADAELPFAERKAKALAKQRANQQQAKPGEALGAGEGSPPGTEHAQKGIPQHVLDEMTENDSLPCRDWQRGSIEELIATVCDMRDDDHAAYLAKVLAKRGVSVIRSLTISQANELIASLNRQKMKLEADAAFGTDFTPESEATDKQHQHN